MVRRPKTRVYVDGFNLYHGAVEHTPYKWLNIALMCEQLLPGNEITHIDYFTAPAADAPDSPDRSIRQRVFWRALDTLPNLTRYLGNFVVRSKKYPLAAARHFDDPQNPDIAYLTDGGPPTAAIIRYMEEKGSDVNLAARLLDDAFRAKFEVAVVISNDQDLVEPIRIVSKDILLPVGIVNPRPKYFGPKLAAIADFKRNIDKRLLRKSQFPDEMADSVGTFRKPAVW